MASGLQKNIHYLAKEILFRRNFVVVVFSIITVLLVTIGSTWPKMYTAHTTIFVEEENIIGPLMEGAAEVQRVVIDRAAIAREIIFGHKIMMGLLEQEGLLIDEPTPLEQEHMINSIKSRMTISNIRRNLIRIEFKDNNPEKSFRITSNLAQLFIDASHAAKAKQSSGAFGFIDKQVQEYKVKLQSAEELLKIFRSENVDAQAGLSGEIGRRSAELERTQEQITQELDEAKIRKASLQRQLSGEAQAASAFSHSEQYKIRISELQEQLDNLRLSYHETYPDIIQIKNQILHLRESVKESETRNDNLQDQDIIIDERISSNPIYQQLQQDLYNTNTMIETLQSRLNQTNISISELIKRARKIEEYEARLQELTRDYEVNRDSYHDLMRRREQARVSMNLDKEKMGLNLRIDEPAYFPHSPSGLRFLHFLLAGPLLGLAIPIGLLFVISLIDPRVRKAETISDNLGIPLLGKTPHLATPMGERKITIGFIATTLLFLATIGYAMTMGILRLQGNI